LIRIVAAALVMLFSASFAKAQDDDFYNRGWDFSYNAYYRNLFMFQGKGLYYDENFQPEEKRLYSDLNRISVSPEVSYDESFILHADADIQAMFSNYNSSRAFELYWIEPDYNRFTRTGIEIARNRCIYSGAEIRSLYAKLVLGSFTGTLGRQQVRFGGSRLWNPLDLLNPFSPVMVEGADVQTGIDAARLDWYPVDTVELTLVFNPVREEESLGKMNMRSSNYLARLKAGWSDLDTALLGGYSARRTNLGCDMQYILFEGMLTAVVLYSDPEDGESYFQCGAGYEYTFVSGIYLLAEYFYNSLPVNEDEKLAAALLHSSISGIDESNYYVLANRMITYNSHYLSSALGYDFHPLVRGELFLIADFQGGGIFINASLRYNVMQNADVEAGLISAFTDSKDRASDFDSYDRRPVVFASFIYYF